MYPLVAGGNRNGGQFPLNPPIRERSPSASFCPGSSPRDGKAAVRDVSTEGFRFFSLTCRNIGYRRRILARPVWVDSTLRQEAGA
jgi:hypothetical protein